MEGAKKEFEGFDEMTVEEKLRKLQDYTLDYERLSEFFFDLCLSWC